MGAPPNNEMRLTGGEGSSRRRWACHAASRVQGPPSVVQEAPPVADVGVGPTLGERT
jgi:hypothetical protein